MVSKLTTQIVTTKKKSKRTLPISKITIHHMAGISKSAESTAKMHVTSTKDVSANYYIDTNGGIVAGVEEEYRAWTSSNKTNDNIAVTIEVSNDTNKKPWSISDKAYNALIALCADICKRYNIIPYYDGTRNATLTIHKMFASTACPGDYIINLLQNGKIEDDINKLIGIKQEIPKTEQQKKTTTEIAKEVIAGKWGVGEDRKKRLTNAGYNYREVQKIVNNMMR